MPAFGGVDVDNLTSRGFGHVFVTKREAYLSINKVTTTTQD